MKRLIFALILLMVLLPSMAAKNLTGNWKVIPLPQEITLTGGKPFVLNKHTTLRLANNVATDKDMVRNLGFLKEYIQEMTQLKLMGTERSKGNQIVLDTDPTLANAEGYSITADQKQIVIKGKNAAAVFLGIQTLRKALPIAKDAKVIQMPAVRINDYPRFHYRGFMIDTGRHFFSVAYLKEIIDMLALHDINYFHWHLTEDQGWRIAIQKYPKLTEIGSHRKQTIIQGSKEYDGTPVDGYYTQEDAREIVKYAADRFITVIPEIDMPGHMMAALASYPELGCTGGPYEVPCKFGVFEDVLCGGKPETLQFAKDVLQEIMDIFPSTYIHIGGDECPKTRWKVCPHCQNKIKELGLKDEPGHTKEDQLQTWFMGEIEKQITSRGRKMLGWDEILEGNPTKSSTVLAWTSYDASIRSAKEGHQTVVCPISNLYFSNPHWNKLTGIKSMERVYNLEPVSDQLTPEQGKRIIGAEGCIWTEWVKDSVKMEWEMMPRIAGLAEIQWTQKEKKDLNDFMGRLPHLVDIYQLEGWNYKKDILENP